MDASNHHNEEAFWRIRR